jgi:hypothetical protein
VGVAIRATVWRMSLMQTPPSAARAGVETKPMNSITKAQLGVLIGRLPIFRCIAVSLLHKYC